MTVRSRLILFVAVVLALAAYVVPPVVASESVGPAAVVHVAAALDSTEEACAGYWRHMGTQCVDWTAGCPGRELWAYQWWYACGPTGCWPTSLTRWVFISCNCQTQMM